MISNAFMYVANRIHLIIIVYVLSLLSAAWLFSYVESKPFFDSLWWACVTSLTIGYGDLFPVTKTGKAIGIVYGHLWIFTIIPMVIANIMTKILIDNNCFTDSEQKDLFNRLDKLQQTIDSK